MKTSNLTSYRSLLALFVVFISGFSGLITVHLLFLSIFEELDGKSRNEQARLRIGEYINKEIKSIEVNYYKMATLFHAEAAKVLKKEILGEIDHIYEALDVLENGGTVENHVELNIAGQNSMLDKITYQPHGDREYLLESIDLKPKLAELSKRLDSMLEIVTLKRRNSTLPPELLKKSQMRVELFLKQSPAHFIRMKENANRLLFESRQNLRKLEQEIAKEKKRYEVIERNTVIGIIIFSLIMGMIIARQISRSNQRLIDRTKEAKELASEAKNADRIKSEFLANMSHEIRTPLNAIIGFSDILKSGNLQVKDREYADIISRSAKSLLAIINDILDISKIESGKMELSVEAFETHRLFDQVIELFSIKAREKMIHFEYASDPDIAKCVIGDSTRIRQVISNILSNAIKFTPDHGRVELSIRSKGNRDEVCTFEISIRDTGIGIPPEKQQAVFDPFSQADGSVSRQFGGTGLGLSICQKILQLMDSEIRLESTVGQGSTFSFELTLPVCEYDSSQKTESIMAFLILKGESGRDTTFNQVHQYLNEIGEVTDYSPELKLQHYDVVFCFGGFELIAAIENIRSRFPEMPFVHVSEEENHEIQKELSPYAHTFLLPPFYGSKVFNVIARLCNIAEYVEQEIVGERDLSGVVLVAEDNEANQQLITLLLERLGLKCMIASNGKEAVEMSMQKHFDVILMDINMPEMDGTEATRIIRERERSTQMHIPIIALTANAIKGDRERYIKEGMDDYLTKPIEFQFLKETLARYISDVPQTANTEESKREEIFKESAPSAGTSYSKQDAMDRLKLDEATLDMLLSNFCLTLPSDIEKLQESVDSKDGEKIFAAAHYIKGACANYAMHEATELLIAMEKAAKNGDTAQCVSLMEPIKRTLESIRQTISKE